MTVQYLKIARAEFEAAVDYYEAQRDGLGLRFRVAVRDLIDQIVQSPEAGVILDGRFRRRLVAKFPYGVIDHFEDQEIVVVAVQHLHREPNRWQGRL